VFGKEASEEEVEREIEVNEFRHFVWEAKGKKVNFYSRN
jgi:hypothetical protein